MRLARTLTRLVMAAVAGAATACAGPPPHPRALSRCPPEMAQVDGTYCIDRWEASLVELLPSGRERPFSPYEPVAGRRVRAVSQEGAVPQAYLSRNEAQQACSASRKRLCTETEWVAACKAGGRGPFPYGAERRAGVCNDEGRAPLPRVFGHAKVNMYSDGPMNDARLNQQPQTVARSGAFTRCTNGLGVYDMVGNLHEWIDDPAGTFRGGYYLDTKLNGPGCEYRTTAHDASYHDYSTGFRCCAAASPPR